METPASENDSDLTFAEEPLDTVKAHVPLGSFAFAALAQLAIIFTIFRLIAPGVLRAELAEPWMILLWTFSLGLATSLFEYLYHRYLLHSSVLPFMNSMQRAHGAHHGLTNVQAPVKASDPEMLATVKSDFPVEEQHQEESMMFPLYSGLIFVAVFLIVLGIPLKLIFRGQPVLTSLIVTVMISYSAYEIWHALLHLPYERFWKPRLKNRVFRRIYGFHLMHHWRPTSNLAIVGFWGLALWDYVFGTHRRPSRMPIDKQQVTYVDSRLRKPRWPISMFDRWQGGWARVSRRIERFLAMVFLHRRYPSK